MRSWKEKGRRVTCAGKTVGKEVVAPLTSSFCASTSSGQRGAGQRAHRLGAGVVAGILTLPRPPYASGLGHLS